MHANQIKNVIWKDLNDFSTRPRWILDNFKRSGGGLTSTLVVISSW